MTFYSRMKTETGSPMPRWLYLALKPVETVAMGVLFMRLFQISGLKAGIMAVVLYVGIGIIMWYRGGIKRWFGHGSFVGDIIYHGILSVPAIIWLWDRIGRYEAIGLTAVCLIFWWLLDTADYGPMRSQPE